jgi:hypothetical protein
MLRNLLVLAAVLVLPFAGGCSDDPPASTPFGPGSGQGGDGGSSGSSGSSGTSLLGDGSATGFDAADPPKDAGYRDPQVIDAGCTAPNMVCNGKCVSLGTDVANCGACGNACTGDGAYCNAGRCACVGPLTDYCAGNGCQDVSSDVNNCGACGNVCDPNQFNDCSAGVCDNQ